MMKKYTKRELMGGEGMSCFVFRMKVEKSELEEIMERMRQAQETILDCYYKLESLGVVVMEKKETTSGN